MRNRYDDLQAQAKGYRNQIENKTAETNVKVEKLRRKISKLQYKSRVYNENINNKLIDVMSLIKNEQDRIERDKLANEYDINQTKAKK